jgi:DNA-binding transcriptional LysR family regulator
MPSPADIDLNLLTVFVALAQAGSFTVTAERLGTSKARISLQIRQLEARLGQTLFARTTRQVRLTDAGLLLYEQCQPLLVQLQTAIQDHSGATPALSGTLRLTAPSDYATLVLAPLLAQFARRHPLLRIDLRSADRIMDLVRDGIDLAIRAGWLKDSSQHARRIGTFEQYLVASADYVKAHGMPTVPADLVEHPWLEFTPLPSALTWEFRQGERLETVVMQSRFRVDNTSTLRSLLLAGAGVTIVAELGVADDLRAGRLVRLLPDWTLPSGGVYAVYPSGQFIPMKTRLFIDFLQAALANT